MEPLLLFLLSPVPTRVQQQLDLALLALVPFLLP